MKSPDQPPDPRLYEIQSGIPIPKIQQPSRQPRCRETRRLLLLEVGESFLVPIERRNHARSRMRWVTEHTGALFEARTLAEGFRIWRVERYSDDRVKRWGKPKRRTRA